MVWTSWLLPAFDSVPRRLVENGLHPAWSPDGQRMAFNSADPGDPIFIADKDGNNPTQRHRAQAGVHNHFLTWSPDGRFIYFVSGTPQTEEMDIWRLRVSPGTVAPPERITTHRAHVAYPAWLDARTLIYAATAEDGSGQWLYTVDVEHRHPHRVSAGVAEEYLSVAVSNATPRRVVAALATPKSTLWTVPLSDHVQIEQTATRVQSPNSRAGGPRVGARYLAFLSSKGGASRPVDTRPGRLSRTLERGRRRPCCAAGHLTRRSPDLFFFPQERQNRFVRHARRRHGRADARRWARRARPRVVVPGRQLGGRGGQPR